MQKLPFATVALATTIFTFNSTAFANTDLVKLCNKNHNVAFTEGDLTGTYHGMWKDAGTNTNMDHTLLVLSHKNEKAVVLYAHGTWKRFNINRPNCSKHKGIVGVNGRGNPVLTIKFPNSNKATYNFYADNSKAAAQYVSSSGTTGGSLVKAK